MTSLYVLAPAASATLGRPSNVSGRFVSAVQNARTLVLHANVSGSKNSTDVVAAVFSSLMRTAVPSSVSRTIMRAVLPLSEGCDWGRF